MFRIAVLGTGKIVRTRFLPAIRELPDVAVAVVGSRNAGAVDLAGLSLPNDIPVLSYEDTLGSGEADAVYIGLPNDQHPTWVVQAARAGLHVLCEKPLTGSPHDALMCQQVCRENGVLLAEAFMYKHDPRQAHVREIVSTGRIGRVHLIEVSFAYFLEDLSNIRLSKDRQGGALMDVGCYGIDLARFLTLEEPCNVTARCVRGARSRVDELVSVTLQFPSGCMAVITASTHLARRNGYCIRGTQGTIAVENAFIPKPDQQTSIAIETSDGQQQVERFQPCDTFVRQIERFVAAAANRDAHLWAPGEDGVANAHVLGAALQSMGSGLEHDLFGDAS